MDAIDAVLVEIGHGTCRIRATHSQSISAEARKKLRAVVGHPERVPLEKLGELDTLLGDAHADIRAVTRRVAELDDAWLATGAVPRKAEQGVAARYKSLQKRFAQRQQQAAQAAAQQELEGTGARARLCERLESGALAGGMAEPERQALLDETEQAWQALAPLDDACEAALRERFVLEGSRAFGVSYIYANLLGNEAGRIIYDGETMIASGGRFLAVGPDAQVKGYAGPSTRLVKNPGPSLTTMISAGSHRGWPPRKRRICWISRSA